MRFDGPRLGKVDRIAPVTFLSNRIVKPPRRGADGDLMNDRELSTGSAIFQHGVPAFLDAMRRTERFTILEMEKVLAARTYTAFPPVLTGVMAGNAQLAEGWRMVEPDDGEPIAALLAEIDADAAMITYWRFSLDLNVRGGIGVDTATPRAHVRAWLVDREGKIAADDEVDVMSDEMIALHRNRYDGRSLTPLYTDSIETCAVKLIADFSNARANAREAGKGAGQ